MCAVYPREERDRAKNVVGGVRLCEPCLRQMYPQRFKRIQLSQEVLLLCEIQRVIPELDDLCESWIWDCPPGDCTRKKPDMLWVFDVEGAKISIHVEIDETGRKHEDELERVVEIQAAVGSVHHWLVRVNPGAYADSSGRSYGPSVEKTTLPNGDPGYQSVTPEWGRRMKELREAMLDVLSRAMSGEEPTEEKLMMFF